MNYLIDKTHITRIIKVLKEHKAAVDGYVREYKAERNVFEAELSSMKGKYTDAYIEETRRNYKPTKNYKDILSRLQNDTNASVQKYIDKLHNEMAAYYNAPVSPEFANKVNAITITGLALTDSEFEMLAKSCGSYMEARILAHIGESREKQIVTSAVNELGTVETRKTTSVNPYHMPDMVSLDECEKALNTYTTNVKNFVQGYCGENAELYEYRSGNIHDTVIDKAVAGAYSYFFTNGYSEDITSIIDRMNKLTNSDGKTKPLSADELKLIDLLIDPNYKHSAEYEAKRYAEQSELVRELLKRDERYAKYIPDNVTA